MTLIEESWRKILLGSDTSKVNKLWIAIGLQSKGYWLEWEWDCTTIAGLKKPVMFRFAPDKPWVKSKSYDDVFQKMKDITE